MEKSRFEFGNETFQSLWQEDFGRVVRSAANSNWFGDEMKVQGNGVPGVDKSFEKWIEREIGSWPKILKSSSLFI